MNHDTLKKELLKIENLSVEYRTDDNVFHAVNNISLEIGHGEILGLVGETGAGKTTLALSIMGLLPEKTGFVTEGKIYFNDRDIMKMSERQMRKIRGSKISMIFQDPMSSLNPLMTIEEQIAEVLVTHQHEIAQHITSRVDEILQLVGIQPERKAEYPHQFSGGMKQRVLIAMALACNPELLIADEPTTALDVTIQAQVLAMMNELKTKLQSSMIMITHDLGVVAMICDKVAVMYAGEIVEKGTIEDIFGDSKHHPYTEGLFGAIPDLTKKTRRLSPINGLMPDAANLPPGCKFNDRCPYMRDICKKQEPGIYLNGTHSIKCLLFTNENKKIQIKDKFESKAEISFLQAADPICLPQDEFAAGTELYHKDQQRRNKILLETKGLKKYFRNKDKILHAVDDINLQIAEGETLGVVGESGCGKTTLGYTVLRLIEPTEGEVLFEGRDILQYTPTEMKKLRQKMQIVFQDPYSSLDPRMTVRDIIAEPLLISKKLNKSEVDNKVYNIMNEVGLSRRIINMYPHEMDGGRRQRVAIGRALTLNPKLIVCDEPVSALDVSIQAQILNLLMDLQDEYGYSYMFITHNLAVVKHISDNILVMYMGQSVEFAPSAELFQRQYHPYTKALLSAIPRAVLESHNRPFEILHGEVTSPINPKPGCRFAPRCPYKKPSCENKNIPLIEVTPNHFVACRLAKGRTAT